MAETVFSLLPADSARVGRDRPGPAPIAADRLVGRVMVKV